MIDYIMRLDALIDVCIGCNEEFPNEPCEPNDCKIKMALSGIPTADVVEVVRCKDCKHLDKGENDSESWCECTAHFGKYFAVNEDGFCSFGERKGE